MIVSVYLPTAVLQPINGWAEASGLSHAEFYRTALILGARIMTSSLSPGFVGALTPEEWHYASVSANTSVTPDVLLQIVLGGKVQANTQDLGHPMTEFDISIPDDQYEPFSEAADGIGMAHEKFYALAFVTGARLAARALEHRRLFPMELLVRSTGGDITPGEWMRAVMGRNTRLKRNQTPGSQDP
ncbi:MAG: hypothetical protein P8189_03875 [Anaerolineae bacterium]